MRAEAASFVSKMMGELLLKKKRGYSFIAGDVVKEIERLRSSMRFAGS